MICGLVFAVGGLRGSRCESLVDFLRSADVTPAVTYHICLESSAVKSCILYVSVPDLKVVIY